MVNSKLADIALAGVLVCSIALNLYQTQKIHSLSASTGHSLQEGSLVPVLAVKDFDGNDIRLQPGKLPLILYFFSESCSWCERNTAHINELELRSRNRYRVVGVSLSSDNVREYALRHGFVFPVYGTPSRSTLEPYKIEGTPQTVVVSPEGRVIASWTGAYNGRVRQELQQSLGIRLNAD
jgi:peroxiredoxin